MTEPAEKKLAIKKYPNRRYYDATHSRHLTLEEIRALIQEGYNLEVIDAKTGKDITAQLLTHIILELDAPKLDSLPVPLLLRLIRMNDLLIKDFIEKYFNQALKSFFEYQNQFEEQLRRTHGLPSALPSVAAWTKAIFQPVAAAFTSPPPASPERTDSAEQENLREMIQDLQRQVARLKGSQKRKAAKPRVQRRKR